MKSYNVISFDFITCISESVGEGNQNLYTKIALRFLVRDSLEPLADSKKQRPPRRLEKKHPSGIEPSGCLGIALACGLGQARL